MHWAIWYASPFCRVSVTIRSVSRRSSRVSLFGALIADKVFDANWIIKEMDERGSAVVISQHPNRREPRQIDRDLYTWRHLVENFFGKLKEFKRIAMRADKTDQSFAALIYLCAAVINSR